MVQFAPQLYYFAPAFSVPIFTAKAVTRFVVTCTSSPVYGSNICDRALDPSSDKWVSDDQGTSAWIRVQLSGMKYVTKLELKAACHKYNGNKVKEVNMEFDDGHIQSVIIIYMEYVRSYVWRIVTLCVGKNTRLLYVNRSIYSFYMT